MPRAVRASQREAVGPGEAHRGVWEGLGRLGFAS